MVQTRLHPAPRPRREKKLTLFLRMLLQGKKMKLETLIFLKFTWPMVNSEFFFFHVLKELAFKKKSVSAPEVCIN